MRILAIGATGYIGSHVAVRLAQAGHEVTAFARNEDGAAKLRALGLEPQIGNLADREALATLAAAADATIFAPQLMLEEERETVEFLLGVYRGTGKTFIFTSGTGVLGQRTAGQWSEDSFAEDDPFVPARAIALRVGTETLVRAAGALGVRGIVVRPPMIWGNRRHVAVEYQVESLRKTGAVCYIGEGLNLYSHVHIDDLAELYRLVLENGVAGALYHAVAGELSYRCIAEFVARRLGVPVRSVGMDEAIAIWGKFPALIVLGASSRSRCPRARSELGWAPGRFDLIDTILAGDLDALQGQSSGITGL